MRIIDLHPGYEQIVQQVASMLVETFKDHWPDAWPDQESALREVHDSLGEGRISRIAVDDNGTVLGWIGGIGMYDGRVWELHPLAVSREAQGRGVGRALVRDLEEQASARGGLTLWLGTDDEDGMTSLAGVDLYPNPLEHLAQIKDVRGHPFVFYQRLGFVIVGVMPDANGPGKPDIYMAKRITIEKEPGSVLSED